MHGLRGWRADLSFFNSVRTQQSAQICVFVAVASPFSGAGTVCARHLLLGRRHLERHGGRRERHPGRRRPRRRRARRQLRVSHVFATTNGGGARAQLEAWPRRFSGHYKPGAARLRSCHRQASCAVCVCVERVTFVELRVLKHTWHRDHLLVVMPGGHSI